MKNILQGQPEFPFSGSEAEAILEAVFLSFHFIIIFFLIILLMYIYVKNMKYNFLPSLVVFGFSLLIGISSLEHSHFPLSPLVELFFLTFQTSIFLLISFNEYNNNTNVKRRKL